jgi:hypothetical protein
MESVKYVHHSGLIRVLETNNHSRNAANYVTESVKGTGSQASKEANKRMLPYPTTFFFHKV